MMNPFDRGTLALPCVAGISSGLEKSILPVEIHLFSSGFPSLPIHSLRYADFSEGVACERADENINSTSDFQIK